MPAASRSAIRTPGVQPSGAPRARRAPVASPAFLMRLVSACAIIVSSRSAVTGASGSSASISTPGWPSRWRSTASRTSAARSAGLRSGSGMRAKRLNSLTIRRRPSVWRTITSVYWVSASASTPSTLENLRWMRCAESWIGVSGFLISWAMRRATSPQAAMRCAATRSETSSKATT